MKIYFLKYDKICFNKFTNLTITRNMADSRVKREVKPPKRFAEDLSFQWCQVEAKRKVTKPDKSKFSISRRPKIKLKFIKLVMLRNSTNRGHALNLHYQFVSYVPGKDSLEDRCNSFYDGLFRGNVSNTSASV